MSTAFVPQKQNRAQDAQFKDAMHGKDSTSRTGFLSAISKNDDAQQAAVDEYFKHWDNKRPSNETEEDKKVFYLFCPLICSRLTLFRTV